MRGHPASVVLALLAATAAASVSACTAGSGGAPPRPAVAAAGPQPVARPGVVGAPLRFGACPGQQARADQCAVLTVPLDRSHPEARAVGLQVVRRPASGAPRIGSLVLNPGGPGGSAVADFDSLLGQLSPVLRERFDVVGVDPRGVGSSAPVRCLDGPAADAANASSPDPLTPDGLVELQRVARGVAAACQQRSGDLLPFVGTADAARDLDDLRAALGDPGLTYLGYSYGTQLGATYAAMFPTKVRALVLDGAVDPTLDPLSATEVQARGFETALQAFLADCQRRRGDCAWDPGGDLLAAYRAVTARIAAAPLATRDPLRPLTSSLALTGVAAALYSRDTWPYLEQALAAAARGDGGTLLALSDVLDERHPDGTYSSLQASNIAVSCRDVSAPLGTAPYVASYRRLQRSAPDFADLALSGYVCAVWPARPTAPPAPLAVRGAPPLLVVGTTGDPATPLSEAVGLVRLLPGSVLLTRDGEGHTGYGASACVRGHADAYLLDPAVLPPAGTVCPR